MKGHKHPLPFKTCKTCQRPFSWRKKWALQWEQVLYCSKSCASKKKHA